SAPPRPEPPLKLDPALPRDLSPTPVPLERLANALPWPRVLPRFPPCPPFRCRAPDWRCAIESPRALPPNLSAVARSRYGVPPRCAGLWLQLLPPTPPAPPTPPTPPGRPTPPAPPTPP